MDVEKRKVFDSRLIQKTPSYAVNKGAMSAVDASFPATSATTEKHLFDIRVPNENTIVDRTITWSSQVGLGVTFTFPAVELLPGDTIFGVANANIPFTYAIGIRQYNLMNDSTPYDSAWGWCAFPLHSMTRTIQATINDTTVQLDTGNVLKEVVRLVDKRSNRQSRTSPSKLDISASCVQDSGLVNSVYGSYSAAATDADEVPNSANWFGPNDPLSKVNPYVNKTTGVPAPTTTLNSNYYDVVGLSSTNPDINSVQIIGIDTSTPGALFVNFEASVGARDASGFGLNQFSLTLYTAPNFTEKLMLSPFVFNEYPEDTTGLFGIKNIQLAMTLQDPQIPRILRQRTPIVPILNAGFNPTTNTVLTNLTCSYAPVLDGRVFRNSEVSVEFLSPSLDILPLPKKSVVPYTDYNCYKTSYSIPRPVDVAPQALAPYSSSTLTTNKILFSQIPDYILLYAKPDGYLSVNGDAYNLIPLGSTSGDYYLPLNNVSLTWGNMSGVLSSYSQQMLYDISVKNGVRQDWQQWAGRFGGLSLLPNFQNINVSEAVGGFVLLKPGKDFALPVGEASGMTGRYSFQATVGVNNTTPNTQQVSLYVVAINSGLFESCKGSSRVIKGVIDERDVISAPEGYAPERIVGGRRSRF